MARIAGIDLPREKRVEIGLTYIYGIGLSTSQKILAVTGVNPDTRVKDLSEEEVNEIRFLVKGYYQVINIAEPNVIIPPTDIEMPKNK